MSLFCAYPSGKSKACDGQMHVTVTSLSARVCVVDYVSVSGHVCTVHMYVLCAVSLC